jgi:hypothetical protein
MWPVGFEFVNDGIVAGLVLKAVLAGRGIASSSG